jgi:hypothetical protein
MNIFKKANIDKVEVMNEIWPLHPRGGTGTWNWGILFGFDKLACHIDMLKLWCNIMLLFEGLFYACKAWKVLLPVSLYLHPYSQNLEPLPTSYQNGGQFSQQMVVSVKKGG